MRRNFSAVQWFLIAIAAVVFLCCVGLVIFPGLQRTFTGNSPGTVPRSGGLTPNPMSLNHADGNQSTVVQSGTTFIISTK